MTNIGTEFNIEYISQEKGPVREAVAFFKQKIVNALGRVVKYELLTKVRSRALDVLMGEITPEERYEFDLNILKKMIAYISLYRDNSKYSVNINPSTFIHPSFIRDVNRIFSEHKFDLFTRLDFEITENGYFSQEEMDLLNQRIVFFQQLGIKIGIDDYPNLNNNNELLERIKNIDFVKIDKGFLLAYKERNITLDVLLRVLGRHIRDIRFRAPSAQIIIEGVENQELFLLLQKHFGDEITLFQGYYFHKKDEL